MLLWMLVGIVGFVYFFWRDNPYRDGILLFLSSRSSANRISSLSFLGNSAMKSYVPNQWMQQ